ncbi:WD40 repeat-like protein [Pluteus cervinus]|uniref:WD40 repeat-like protein n=1 Tax=Pluteus cervinus TaxID=181527 RepID=A0ACD3B273_9AGAR|nr:WD40 repeat-like protein [Pluteus cervinus]
MASTQRTSYPANGRSSEVSLHLTEITVNIHNRAKYQIRLESVIPALSGKPTSKVIHKSNVQHVATRGDVVWAIDQSFPINNSEMLIKLFISHHFSSNKLVAQYKLSIDNVLEAFFDAKTDEFELDIPGSPVKAKFKRDSLLNLLKQVVPPKALVHKLGKAEQAVNLITSVASAFSQFDPTSISQTVLSLISSVTEKLQQQKVCYSKLSDLVDRMANLLPCFQKVEDFECWNLLHNVVQDILNHMENCLQVIESSSKQGLTAQLLSFSFSPDQQDQFSKLSTDFDDLLQRYDIALKSELAFITVQNEILKHLEKLKYVGASPGDICLPGTRVQIQDDILVWAKTGQKSIFWLSGLAGTGKSTIAATLVQKLQSLSMLGAYFTCKRDKPALSSPVQLLQTICYELASVHRPYGRLVSKVIRDDPYFGFGTPNISTLFTKLFETPLKGLCGIGRTDLVIVIDALDECGDRVQRIELLNCLLQLKDLCSRSNLKLLVLITSRSNEEIRKLLRHSSQMHEIKLSQSSDDIETFLKQKCADIKEMNNADITELVTAASGLFIWAQIACTYLKGRVDYRNAFNTLLKPTQATGQLYSLLYKTYETILSEAIPYDSQDGLLFQKVMGSIFLSAKPLSFSELINLVDAPQQAVENLIEKLHAVILQNSQGILTVIHVSFIEYIQQGECPSSFRVHSSDIHFGLAQQCLHILQNQLQFNICHLESSYVPNNEISNLQDKIEKYIRPELQTQLDKQLLSVFYGPKALYWIEVVCFLDQVFHILKEITKLCALRGNTKIYNLFYEIGQFIDKFKGPIQISTPHIYISGVAFIPDNSVLRLALNEWTKRTVRLKSGKLNRWISELETVNGLETVFSVAYSPNGKHIASGLNDTTIRIWDASNGQSAMQPLTGHTGSVQSVAYSPNSKYIVSASHDKTVRIWIARIGQQAIPPLEGHTGPVSSVAYSPDSTCVVSGSEDKTIRIWNAVSGQPLQLLIGHNGAVWSVAYSSDGRHVTSGSSDKTVRIWDIPSGQLAFPALKGHSDSVWAVAYSPDGQYIVSGSSDKTVMIWNAHNGQPVLKPLKGHTRLIKSVSYSPDGRYIISGSYDVTIRIWDAASGQLAMQPLKGHSGAIWSIAYSPDGRHIASGSSDKSIRVWDTTRSQPAMQSLEGHSSAVKSIAYSPDGMYIVSGSHDKTIRTWNATSGHLILELSEAHTDSVHSVAYSPCGNYIASGSSDKTIKVWDTRNGDLILLFEGHSGSIWSVAYSPNGESIASGSDDKTIRLWNTMNGELLLPPFEGHSGSIWTVAYSPSDKHIASGSSDHTIRIWDTSKEMALSTLRGHHDSVWSVCYSPDGEYIVSGSYDKTVRIWNAKSGQKVIQPLTLSGHIDKVCSVAYSPDGAYIISGSYDETIRIWDAHNGQPAMQSLIGHNGSVWSVAYSPDGTHIASGSSDLTIGIWDATSTLLVQPLEGHSNAVISVAYSPDGRSVVSGSSDKTVRIWDAANGQPVMQPFYGHEGPVQSVSYSPNGNYIVSGSDDQTIRVWNATNGILFLQPLTGHDGPISSVAYSPNGLYIVSGSHDKTVRIWDALHDQQAPQILTGHTDSVWSVAFSPDSQQIVSGSSDQDIIIWNVIDGGKAMSQLKGHSDFVSSVAYSPDGAHIVSGSPDRTIRIWDTQNGQLVKNIYHDTSIKSVAYLSDGQHIVSASHDRTVRIWNATSGQLTLQPLQGHSDSISAVTASSDGRYLVSAADDMTIRIWDTTSHQHPECCVYHNYSAVHFPIKKHILPLNDCEMQSRYNHLCVPCNNFLCSNHTDFLTLALLNGYISNEGWLTYENKLLLWVPVYLRKSLLSPNTIIISQNPSQKSIVTDWTDFVYGEHWDQFGGRTEPDTDL